MYLTAARDNVSAIDVTPHVILNNIVFTKTKIYPVRRGISILIVALISKAIPIVSIELFDYSKRNDATYDVL